MRSVMIVLPVGRGCSSRRLQERQHPGGPASQRRCRAVAQRVDVAERRLEQVEAQREVAVARPDAELGECLGHRLPGTSRLLAMLLALAGPDALRGEVEGVEADGDLARRTAPSPRPGGRRRPCPCSSAPSHRASRRWSPRRRRGVPRRRGRRPAAGGRPPSARSWTARSRRRAQKPALGERDPDAAGQPGDLAAGREPRGAGDRPVLLVTSGDMTSTSRPDHRAWWSTRGARKAWGRSSATAVSASASRRTSAAVSSL